MKRSLWLAAFVLALLAVYPASVATAQEGPEISGLVLLNETLAPAGTQLVVRRADDSDAECGAATVQAGGFYQFTLDPTCQNETLLAVSLVDTDESLEVALSSDTTRIDFFYRGLSQEELLQLGAITPEPVIPIPLAESEKPLINDSNLLALLLLVVGAGMFLLVLMVAAKAAENIAIMFAPTVSDEVARSRSNFGAYRTQIEGMVLVMVIVAVILLGVTEKISDEGLVSVLAGISGYAVGRSASASADGSR